VKGMPHPDSGSAEEISAVADRKSTHHPHDSCLISFDKHPNPESSKADAAAPKSTPKIANRTTTRSIDPASDDLDDRPPRVIPEHRPRPALTRRAS
jgi:hypothetical protein